MKDFVRNTALLAGLIILDQILKIWAYSNRVSYDFGLVAFSLVKNTGASFGMLQGSNDLLIWVSLIVLGLIMLMIDKIRKEHSIPILLIVAGIISNLIDRIFRGFVIDFIDLKFWPVFNLADSCIVIGVIWLCIVFLVEDYKERKEENEKISAKKSAKNKKPLRTKSKKSYS